MARLEGKLALVTGASRGIGYQCALALAKAGAHVIAVSRTVGGLEELDDEIQAAGGSATLVPLDLLDHEAIDRLGGSIHERWGKLDILVGSAGMLGGLSPTDHFEPKTVDKTLSLNVTANWRLIRSLAPLLAKGDKPRAVFLTAHSDKPPKAFWGLYAMTQSALQTMVMSWASETKKTDLRINLLDPGPTRTALRAQAMPGEDQDALAAPKDVCEPLLRLLDDDTEAHGRIFSVLKGDFI